VNALDVVLLALLALAGLSGYRRGLALQALSFGGLLVGLVVGALLAPAAARLVESPSAQAGVAIFVLVTLGGLGDAIGWVIGSRLRERARATRFGRADAAGGAAVALVASLLAIWFVALNLVSGPFPGLSREVRESAIVRTLDGALPEPPSLLAEVRRFFNRFGFPDVFTGLPPPPVEPVEPPTSGEARDAFQAAADSTVKVLGQACDNVQEGSGFVAADGYVVTNAHVLAGVDAPLVQTQTGDNQEATTVLFDSDLDLAILLVGGHPGPVLSLTAADAERGDGGAVLGFPGGGPLSGEPAAVLRAFEAVGRDIYGTGTVDRFVLELQTQIRPGNSGGPFVLPDGSVAGVVFASSTTDDRIGYAIAAGEVRASLENAIGSTSEVDTGPCIR
jgi:S1-C subfamily serine protease